MRYVALPDVALDPTGRAEGALIRRGLPYLRAVYRNRHWAIYEVLGTPGLADGVGRLTKLAPQSFDLAVRQPGFTLVRVRFTPVLADRPRARLRHAQQRPAGRSSTRCERVRCACARSSTRAGS